MLSENSTQTRLLPTFTEPWRKYSRSIFYRCHCPGSGSLFLPGKSCILMRSKATSSISHKRQCFTYPTPPTHPQVIECPFFLLFFLHIDPTDTALVYFTSNKWDSTSKKGANSVRPILLTSSMCHVHWLQRILFLYSRRYSFASVLAILKCAWRCIVPA